MGPPAAFLTYDDACGLCTAIARALRTVDRSGLVFVPMSDGDAMRRVVGPFFQDGPVPDMFFLREGDDLAWGATAVPAILRRVLWRPAARNP
jgi:predicted DCC family thiol-disulfide oxidoreductase YuxK